LALVRTSPSVSPEPGAREPPGHRLAGRRRSLALRRRPSPFQVLSIGLALVLAACVLYPLIRVLLATFVVHGSIDLHPFAQAFSDQGVPRLLFNTVAITLPAGFLALTIGFLFAWLNERTDARVGGLTDVFPLLPFFLPPIAGAIGWVYLLDPTAGFANSVIRGALRAVGLHISHGPVNIYSWGGLIFVYTLYLVPFAYLMLSTGLRNLDPSLEEQARVCGSGKLRTFVRVTLPALKPSLGAAALLMIVFGFSLFSVPLIIGTGANIQVLSVRIVDLMTASFPPNTGAATALGLLMVVITGSVWYAQTRIVGTGRFATIGGKSHGRARHRIGAWKWPARAALFGYVFVAAVLPIIALLLVALNGYWTTHISWSTLNLKSFQLTLDDVATQHAFVNSVKLAIAGSIIGILVSAVIAVGVGQSKARGAKVLSGIIKLPAAISPIIFAIGFILALAGPPFSLGGTLVILLIAFVVVFLPWASVAADAAAAQVGSELVEASRTSGAGGLKTLVRINLPLMLPGLVAGAALLFVLMMGDIDISIMLAGYPNETVGFQILSIFDNTSWTELAALAIMLTTISTVVVTTAFVATRRWARWQS
jgi:iron(III) transport system permease protein